MGDPVSPRRLLIAGPLGPTPHILHQALGMAARGFDVHVGGSAPPGRESPELEDSGLPIHRAPDVRRRSAGGMVATIRWMRALIGNLQPDLVHAHWLPGFGFVAAAAGASPLVVTPWGSDVYRANRLKRLANRFAVRRADLVTAPSSDLRERCIELGAPAERAAVVDWGVDLGVFHPSDRDRASLRSALGLGPGPVLLSPRGLLPVYNIPTIIEAFEQLGEQMADLQLVLKPPALDLDALPELPHRDRVHLVGHVPHDEMADYYRVADVCVSLTSSDGAPRSVAEAMACGTPCVVSDLPWVRQRLTPGRDVVSVPVNAHALAEALADLLRNPARAREIGDAGREVIVRELDSVVQMDRLAELYGQLLARASPSERSSEG